MCLKMGGRVEKVNGKELSYSEFVERYLVKNIPVVLTGLMDDWRACKDWVSHDGKPNLSFISTHFAKSTVPVADCSTREFSDQKRLDISVSEFIDRWMTKVHSSKHSDDSDSNGKSLLYLKDWHFVKEYPQYHAYRTPLFFSDDWLNLYLDKYPMHIDSDTYNERNEISCSDYRFVYMGEKGTWTPLHADVFRSYSWSANVCGKKHWYLLPPDQSHLVFDRNMKYSVYDIFENVSETNFPGFKKAIWWECSQEQNEIIFVPSGWFHQEDAISINHNWFNAYNISWVLDLLLRDYNEAKEYIEDIKDICDNFEELCQRNLAANTGMNFYDFYIFLVRFSYANLVQLSLLIGDENNSTWRTSQICQHIIFNLEVVRSIALKMKSISIGNNYGSLWDILRNMDDHSFKEFCADIGKTYGLKHEQDKLCFGVSQFCSKVTDMHFGHLSASHVCSFEDLVQLIDGSISKLNGNVAV